MIAVLLQQSNDEAIDPCDLVMMVHSKRRLQQSRIWTHTVNFQVRVDRRLVVGKTMKRLREPFQNFYEKLKNVSQLKSYLSELRAV